MGGGGGGGGGLLEKRTERGFDKDQEKRGTE